MESVTRFFLIAASLLITAGLIFVSFRMAEAGENVAENLIENYSQYAGRLAEEEILQFDGVVVSGSDVINFLRKQLAGYSQEGTAPISAVVATDRTVALHKDNTGLSQLQNFSHPFYINPNAQFEGYVERNENGVITLVRFEQC